MEEVLIDWGIVAGAAVVVAFVVNQAAAWAGVKLSGDAKRAIAFAASAGLAGYFAFQGDLGLPDPSADPAQFAVSLLAATVLVFKAAQQIYDRLWQNLVRA